MFDDSDELARELSYTPRKNLFGRPVERPPRGAHAITGFAVLYTGAMWLATLAVSASVSTGPPSSGVVSPGACFLLVVMGVEMAVAGMLAGATWRALGPVARSVIRPFMVLGPWPLVIGGLLGFSLLAGLATGKITPAQLTRPRGQGENYRLIALEGDERYGVDRARAASLCAALGPGWKLPSREEFGLLRPPLSPNCRSNGYWLQDPADPDAPWRVHGRKELDACMHQFDQAGPGADAKHLVVCFSG